MEPTIASRILKNFLSLSGAALIHSVIAVISTIYLARVLSPDGYGKVSFAFALVQLFLVLSAFGLDTLGIREVARNKEKVKEYLGNILSLKLALAFLLFIVLLVIINYLNKPEEINHLIFLYGLVLFPSALFFEWTWQGLERMGNIGMSKIIRQCIYLALLIFLVKNSKDISFVPLAFLGVNILYAIILYGLFLRNYGTVSLRYEPNKWKILIKDSTPIGISLVLGIVIYNINTILLNFFRTDYEVGHYNAAFQIISFVLIFIVVLFDVLFPTLSRLYHTSIGKMEKILSLSGKALIFLTVPIAVGGSLLAPRLMNLIFGNEYNEGAAALRILLWFLVMVAINTIYARGLLAVNLQNYLMKAVVLQALILLTLSIIFIKYFGIKGAALATLLTEIIMFYPYYKGFTSIVRGVHIRKNIPVPFISSGVMGLFLIIFNNWNVFVLIASAILIYAGMVYFLKGIDVEEIKWIVNNALGKEE